MADLYVLSSARANNLLTVATHEELDRDIMYSAVFWAYSADEIDALEARSSIWADMIGQPGDGHDDPIALDLQVFYDKITERLNKLGGLQLPMGTRYGTHPKRNADWTNKDPDGHPHSTGNVDGQLHVFPWQSNPKILSGDMKQRP
jgi:hypothetical protein